MLVVEVNQRVDDEGRRSLERAVVRKGSGECDEEVNEETECHKTHNDAGNSFVDEE